MNQRKNQFSEFPMIPPEIDLVEREDQITFKELSLDDETLQKQELLDVFSVCPE